MAAGSCSVDDGLRIRRFPPRQRCRPDRKSHSCAVPPSVRTPCPCPSPCPRPRTRWLPGLRDGWRRRRPSCTYSPAWAAARQRVRAGGAAAPPQDRVGPRSRSGTVAPLLHLPGVFGDKALHRGRALPTGGEDLKNGEESLVRVSRVRASFDLPDRAGPRIEKLVAGDHVSLVDLSVHGGDVDQASCLLPPQSACHKGEFTVDAHVAALGSTVGCGLPGGDLFSRWQERCQKVGVHGHAAKGLREGILPFLAARASGQGGSDSERCRQDCKASKRCGVRERCVLQGQGPLWMGGSLCRRATGAAGVPHQTSVLRAGAMAVTFVPSP